ncbi:succinylglutamate desuccinylase/aspartoacylase family protein [Alkalimarinus coralli]|uniref:succinylglutamate desuccinylase/aspartoacylase family protein n=1 Tax=Alkalimarinus coralli TaxID=2935863 RepID=UPI00202B3988|nr:succinylglutamate desuccinylase/aspartoacylase family protein [Alkalimarinus coralli]
MKGYYSFIKKLLFRQNIVQLSSPSGVAWVALLFFWLGQPLLAADNEISENLSPEMAKQEEELPASYVAPNVDLKEVAPLPKVVEKVKKTSPKKKVLIDDESKNTQKQSVASDQGSEKVEQSLQGKTEGLPPGAQDGSEALVGSEENSYGTVKSDLPDAELSSEINVPSDRKTESAKQDADDAKQQAKDLILLGAKVPPGTSTRLAWSPEVAITGLTLPVPVLVVNGKNPGNTLCLTAAIHGDELNGIEVVRRVMYDINPDKLSGSIIGVPIVNLQGFQRGSRYLVDRRDLNRHFPGDEEGSLASRIAYSLYHEVIAHCDALVDLHTGSLRRTNLPQLRADMSNPLVVKFTENFDEMVVVHGAGSPGMLRHAAVEAGIPAVTLEIGESLRLQEGQVESGVKSINSLLDRQGMYSRFFSWGDPEPIYYQSVWIRAERGGILFSKIGLGDTVEKGEVLGEVTDPITNSVSVISAPFTGRVIGMAVNQVVMPGFAAYHLGIKASEKDISRRAAEEKPNKLDEEADKTVE